MKPPRSLARARSALSASTPIGIAWRNWCLYCNDISMHLIMKLPFRTHLNRFSWLKSVHQKLSNYSNSLRSVSSHYFALRAEEVTAESARFRDSWKNYALPQRQRELVDQKLSQYRSCICIDVCDVFVDVLSSSPDVKKDDTLLEACSSSNFYLEDFDIFSMPFKRSGCDYPEEFLKFVREKFLRLILRSNFLHT